MGCGDFFLRRLTRWHILLIGFFLKYIPQKLAWLHNKIGHGGKKRRNQSVRIVCLHQEEFGFCMWLGSPLLWNVSRPGILWHTGAHPDGHQQQKEGLCSSFQVRSAGTRAGNPRENAQCSDPAFVRQLQMQVCWLRAASRE